jgi:hypothetical protein
MGMELTLLSKIIVVITINGKLMVDYFIFTVISEKYLGINLDFRT